MSLNIFPDLLTNVEITRIICEILPEPSSNLMKSPRMLNREVMMKDYLLSYADFEKLLVKVAVKAFKTPSEQVFFGYNFSMRVTLLTLITPELILTIIQR